MDVTTFLSNKKDYIAGLYSYHARFTLNHASKIEKIYCDGEEYDLDKVGYLQKDHFQDKMEVDILVPSFDHLPVIKVQWKK